jgi:hypothetical protein
MFALLVIDLAHYNDRSIWKFKAQGWAERTQEVE